MANNFTKPNPPLAGRPPFATNEPDSLYGNSPATRRRRAPQPNNQNNRPTSAYDVYDNYINDKNARQSGYGDLGAGLLNGDMDDDSDDETIAYHGDIRKDSDEKIPPPPSVPAVPIMAPKPGYAAPLSALTMPEPAASPIGQQRSQQMHRQPQMRQNVSPVSVPSVPSTPHPLQPPMTPITPAFARPPLRKSEGGVKFDSDAIMRSQKEDLPLARRGQKGDDFWRRFSMVVREESGRKSTSSWLEKTQRGAANMSRTVWIIGILILIVIGGAIGLGMYISHNSNTETHAKALGGSEGQGADLTIVTTTTGSSSAAATTTGVRPTLTVDKRFAMPEPTPGAVHVVHTHVNSHHVAPSNSSRRQRRKRRLL